MWTIALALDRVNETTCMNVGNYHSSVLFEDCYATTNKLIQAEIEKTNFVGISVRYLFCIYKVLCYTMCKTLHTGLYFFQEPRAYFRLHNSIAV